MRFMKRLMVGGIALYAVSAGAFPKRGSYEMMYWD